MSTPTENQETFEELTQKLREAVQVMEESKDTDSERWAKADAERVSLAEQLQTIKEKLDAEEREAATVKAVSDMNAFLAEQRTSSKASQIGPGLPQSHSKEAELFFVNVAKASDYRNPWNQAEGKAALEAMGVAWANPDPAAKATLGTTDAGGGYLVPNNQVADIERTKANVNIYRALMTVITGVTGDAVDIPFTNAASRAVVVARGATKPNTDLVIGNYTATLYTLAKIYDVADQLLRHSAGAVEQEVRLALSESIAEGEAYYILNGSGTSEPKGLLTSIGTSGAYVSSFTASATTLAGSIATAIATAAGAVAGRNWKPDGAVVHSTAFWTAAAQGTDTAGFFYSPAGGPGAINPMNGTLTYFGMPVQGDSNMPADDLLVGQFRGAKFFASEAFRVDVSREAGDRWDKNLVGFRGEEEFAFNADPYVLAGRFQRILDILP
jgi:HK97 family phage major capsid protein